MYLSKVTMLEVDEIVDQARRNHRLDSKRHREMTDHISNNLNETSGGLRTSTLREAVSMGLSLSTECDRISIDRGWHSSRFRFIIELVIEEPRRTSPGSRMVISGWTDRFSLEKKDNDRNEKLIDPDTVMYVNHIVVVRDFLREDRRGQEYVESKIFDNYQMLLGDYYNSRERRGNSNEYLMRPAEIFAMIDRIDDVGDTDDDVYDTRTLFNTGVRSNNGSNNQRMHFLKSIMDSDVDGRGQHRVYGNRGHSSTGTNVTRDIASFDVAREQEVNWKRNAFFAAIVDRNRDFVGSRSFTYEDLVDFTERRTMRDLDDITSYTEMNDARASDSGRLTGASRELINAFTVCYEIPTIMADSHIAAIEFTVDGTMCDSRRRRAEMVIIPNSVRYILDGDFGNDLIDAFETRFLREVFDVISESGNIPIYMHVNTEIGGMTVIEMEYDGGDMVRRVFATFANSMAAPVITRDERSALSFAKNYLAIRRDVVDRALADNDLEVDEDNDYEDRRTAVPKFARLS